MAAYRGVGQRKVVTAPRLGEAEMPHHGLPFRAVWSDPAMAGVGDHMCHLVRHGFGDEAVRLG